MFSAALAWQMPWREYPGQDNIAVPPDYQEKTEWAFARLMYPPYPGFGRGFGRRRGGDWRNGRSSWTTDYTAADRHVAVALRRLTRIHVRSVEQPVNLDDGDDVFNYPWLYAVEVGHWQLTDSQVKQMRDFLDRGGFFMCDDFHGTQEWAVFMETMQRVFPDRQVVDIPDSDAIFHTIYDLDGRYQVPGAQYLQKRPSPTSRTDTTRNGEASTTTKAGSWSRFATIWTWVTRGSTPTTRNMTRSSRRWRSGSCPTTSFIRCRIEFR